MKKHKLRSVCQAALISVLLCIPIHGVAEDEGLYKGPYHDESTDDRNQRNGPCLDADKFNKAWKTALKQCRMTYRRAYICRHTRASEVLMADIPPAFAAKQTGHTTEMFLNIYAEWISGVKDKELRMLLSKI